MNEARGGRERTMRRGGCEEGPESRDERPCLPGQASYELANLVEFAAERGTGYGQPLAKSPLGSPPSSEMP